MDNAVALVRAYLQLNGYFVVTEYPVLETTPDGQHQAVTDLDVLAFRFPGAGRHVDGAVGHSAPAPSHFAPDPALATSGRESDMLIGEVKEGRARLNENATRRDALEVVLARFGCCTTAQAPALVQALLSYGAAVTPAGHRIRLVVFASLVEPIAQADVAVVSLGHVTSVLRDYLRRNWKTLHSTQIKDPALGFLLTLEKALHAQQSNALRHATAHPSLPLL